MAQADIDLALVFLEDINAQYKNMPEHQRASFWRVIKKRRKEQAGLVLGDEQINGLVMTQRINQEKQCPDYELGVRLLKTYVSQARKGEEHVNPFLKDWVLNGLDEISNCKKLDEVYGLKRGKGRPEGSSVYTDLQISCAYHYFLRQGHKKTEAEQLVNEKFNIEPRLITNIKARFPVNDSIDVDVLKALMEDDYRELYGTTRN